MLSVRSWSVALLSLLLQADWFDARHFVNAVTLRVKGPPSIVLQLKSGRTASGHSSLLQNSAPLGLWCQAVDANTLEVIPSEEISFKHNAHIYAAVFTDDSHRNATVVKEQASVDDMGRWTCHVRTKDYGNATGDIMVYLRPVVNTSLRVDDRSSSKFHFDLSGLTVVHEEDARLECPVTGNPKPTITWKKNGHNIHRANNPKITISNNTLTVSNVTDADSGTYSCTAYNTIQHKNEKQNYDVRADRHLRVKSRYAWVAPLIVIIVIIVLLIVTIVLCEVRKRRNETKDLLPEED